MSQPRRPPPHELEWTLADAPDDAAGETPPAADPGSPAPRPRRRWWRFGLALVLVAAVAAAGAGLAVRAGWQRLRAQVAAEAAYEDAQSLARAVDNVVGAQAADDPAWRQVRAAEAAVGLPSALPAAHLLPSGEPPTLTDLRLVDGNVFAANLQRSYVDSSGQRFTFDYTQRYRNLGAGLWERLPPDVAFAVDTQTWEGFRLRAVFPASEAALLEPLLAQLDLWLAQICTDWRCPTEQRVTLVFNVFQAEPWLNPRRPTWVPDPSRAPYPATFDLFTGTPPTGDPLTIILPALHLAGVPHDAAAEQALLRAWTMQALIALAPVAADPPHAPFAAALVARAEARLGLAAPLNYAPAAETYRAPQSAWALPAPDAATQAADQRQALALLNSALSNQPPRLEAELWRILPTANSAAAWLGAALDTDGPALLRGWAANVQAALDSTSSLPRAAVAGLAYSCSTGAALLRAGAVQPLPIRNNWVALKPEAVSADGRYFAAIERIDPLHINLRLIDLATGLDRTVDSAGDLNVLGWTADGRLLYQRLDDASQPAEFAALAQFDPATDAWSPWLPEVVVPGYVTPVWWTPAHRALFLPIRTGRGTLGGLPTGVLLAQVEVAGPGAVAATYAWESGARLEPGRGLVARSKPAEPLVPGGLWVSALDDPNRLLEISIGQWADDVVAPNSVIPLAWSPDGARVALVARGPNYGVAVISLRPDGSGAREHLRLSDPESVITALAWSADGAYLALQVTAADGQAAQTVVAAAESEEVWAEPLAGQAGLAWAPTGHRLAVLTPDGVRVRDLDTGAVRWVTLAPCDQIAWYDLPDSE